MYFAGSALKRGAAGLSRARLAALFARSATKPVALRRSTAFPTIRSLATATPGSDAFASGTNSAVLESIYDQWRENPSSVPEDWNQYFNSLERHQFVAAAPGTSSVPMVANVTPQLLQEQVKLMELIRSYRVFGHLSANLDPLGLWNRPPYAELDYKFWGFTDADLSRKFFVGAPLAPGDGWMPLGEIMDKLKYTYCSQVGVEYMHMQDVARKDWVQKKLEERKRTFSPEKKKMILAWLTWGDKFELYLAKKYPFTKRFGLEGAESLIPCLEAILERGTELGVESAILGMPHRGRLNVLANVMKKPMYKMFAEFEDKKGTQRSEDVEGSGDVMYHLGASTDRKMASGKDIHLSLVSNPSHLEAVNPVVIGKTRAKMFWEDDYMFEKSLSILMHGDAAFAGQGVVAETMNLNDLPDYTVGGCIHIVVNNQIGFTTNPKFSRSSPYPTDIAKGFQAPIFHVNGDDPEAVVWAAEAAMEFRQTFRDEVVIDIFCYRRHGHNEIDEPMFTQPVMYKKIQKTTSTLDQYRAKLLAEGTFDQTAISDAETKYMEICNAQYEKTSQAAYEPPADWLKDSWSAMLKPSQLATRQETGVPTEVLKEVGALATDVPNSFRPHRKIAQIYDARRKMYASGKALDWGAAETLTFGSLLNEGYHVRLSGQDCERGTFSHRHAVIYDQETEARHCALANISRKPTGMSLFTVVNSSLSEYGVMGFEYGYSLENPNALVIWEAQFGDFAGFNGAQIMIDQFISSAEQKWYRQSGLVLLLPHGYEGQGPEHSSARLERFLQSVNEEPEEFPEYSTLDPQEISASLMKQTQNINMVVANPTTPANLYHLLRRQVHRMFRKPLILLSPKSLLKAPYCVSDIEDFGPGKRVLNVIPDELPDLVDGEKVRKVIFCTGKVYYDLIKGRTKNDIKDVAVIRIEQLSPFPFLHTLIELKKYPNAEMVWAQEEPRNQGAWSFVRPRLLLTKKEVSDVEVDIRYAGRAPSAAPATGSKKKHYAELEAFVRDAFGASEDPKWKGLDYM